MEQPHQSVMKTEQLCWACSLTGQTFTPSMWESAPLDYRAWWRCFYVCTQHVSTFHTHTHTHTLVWVGWIAEASDAPTLGSWVTHPLSVLPSAPTSHPWNKTHHANHALSRTCAWNQTWYYLHLRVTCSTIIGASVSEPHTSELNDRFSLIYIYIIIYMYHTSFHIFLT